MKKPDFVKKIAQESGFPVQEIDRILKVMVRCLQDVMKAGDVVSLSGLGSFRSKARKARPARNPKTGEIIQVPAGKKVSFKPTATLRKTIQ
jgi:nucleoid DNA-binding protein